MPSPEDRLPTDPLNAPFRGFSKAAADKARDRLPSAHIEDLEEDSEAEGSVNDSVQKIKDIFGGKGIFAPSPDVKSQEDTRQPSVHSLEKILDATPFDTVDAIEKGLGGKTILSKAARNQIILIRRAYLTTLYESKHGRVSVEDVTRTQREYTKALAFMKKELAGAAGIVSSEQRKEIYDTFIANDQKVIEQVSAEAAIQDSAVVSETFNHRQQDAIEKTLQRKETLSKKKWFFIKPITKSSFIKTVRNGLLAVFAGSLVAGEINEPQVSYPIEDTGVRGQASEAAVSAGQENAQSVSIEIPSTGALTALKQVVEHSAEFPWLASWLESVRNNARQDLVSTREGRLDVIAQALGFVTYMPGEQGPHGQWIPFNEPVPEGARITIDTHGLSVHLPSGDVQQLIVVENGSVTGEHTYNAN